MPNIKLQPYGDDGELNMVLPCRDPWVVDVSQKDNKGHRQNPRLTLITEGERGPKAALAVVKQAA